MRKGNKYLRTVLVQVAWRAIQQKDSYFRAKYYSKIPKMGAKKAICLIAHKLLINVYNVLETKKKYEEERVLDKVKIESKQLNYHIRYIQKLGYSITLKSEVA